MDDLGGKPTIFGNIHLDGLDSNESFFFHHWDSGLGTDTFMKMREWFKNMVNPCVFLTVWKPREEIKQNANKTGPKKFVIYKDELL